jgi:microcystin degradation protein MlrC
MMRVGIAGLFHETNTYAVRRATLDEFARFELDRGAAILERHAGTGTVIGGFLDGLGGCEPVPLLAAGAWPCGPAPAEVIDRLLADLDAALAAAGPLDGVLLGLHGAMVAEGCHDPELAVLRIVRSHVGERPVAAVFDLHGNLSPEAVALCDAVVAYDTYPHEDMRERGAEAAALLRAGAPLRSVIAKVPLLSGPLAQATAVDPMAGLLARARELAGADERIARVSLLPGFPYSDVARAGFSVVVSAHAGASEDAAGLAAELAGEARAREAAFAVERLGVAEAVEQALRAEPPVVLADVGDNVGGGSPGDGTAVLEELLRRGAERAVVQIADPEVARRAAALGRGARIEAQVGGKTDDRHGAPVAIRGTIRQVTDGRFTSSSTWMTGQTFTTGTTAVVQAGGVAVVVTEHAVPPFHADALLGAGVDLAAARIVVAKGAVAWRAAFGDLARTVIEVDTPGICPVDLSRLERRTEPVGFDPRA